MSLDARIADAAGSMDWLAPFNDLGNDFGYAEFYAGIDAIVMGRATYQFIAEQPIWPYPGTPCYIVTSRPLTPLNDDVIAVPPDFDALRERLAGDEDDTQTVWVMGGGRTQRGALDADMFDELQLFIMPLILGTGPLVFSDGQPTDATLTDHKIWPGGIAQLTYTF